MLYCEDTQFYKKFFERKIRECFHKKFGRSRLLFYSFIPRVVNVSKTAIKYINDDLGLNWERSLRKPIQWEKRCK